MPPPSAPQDLKGDVSAIFPKQELETNIEDNDSLMEIDQCESARHTVCSRWTAFSASARLEPACRW